MQFVQNQYTIRFVEAVNFLITKGFVKNRAQICRDLDYIEQSFSQIMNGRINITMDLLSKSFSVYNVSPMFILSGEGSIIVQSKELNMMHEPQSEYKTGQVIRSGNGSGNGEKGQENAHLKLLDHATPIPIVDISVAAGDGYINPTYLEDLDHILVPNSMLRKGAKMRLFVNIRGESMAPTLFDGSKLLIGLIDQSDWQYNIIDGFVYVITTKEGKAYVKRVKNRIDRGFLLCSSDHVDKSTHPNFNIGLPEIQSVWYAEAYISFKMPNINDDYHAKLNRLENTVEDMSEKLIKVTDFIHRVNKDKGKLL